MSGIETAILAAVGSSAATAGGAAAAGATTATALLSGTAATTAATAATGAGLFGSLGTALTTALPFASAGATLLAAGQRSSALSGQAQLTRLSAEQASVAATSQELAGRAEALQVRQTLMRTLATQSARYAAAGIALDDGAPGTVADRTAAEAETQLDIIRGNAGIAAGDQRLRGAALGSQADSLTSQGQIALLTGGLAAGASLFDYAERRASRAPGTVRTSPAAVE